MYRWFVLSICLLAGCGMLQRDARVLTDADNGQKIELKSGQRLKLELESNPTTGYNWELEIYDREQLELVDSGYAPGRSAQDGAVGAGGKQWWRFIARDNGAGGLLVVYKRQWEKGVKPEKQFEVTVHVSGAKPKPEPPVDLANPHGMMPGEAMPPGHGEQPPEGGMPPGHGEPPQTPPPGAPPAGDPPAGS
jgi:predicted secreted protein